MPTKPKYAVTSAQSPADVAAGYKRQSQYAEAHRFYNSARWRKLRAMFLRAHPLCVDCEKLERATLATQVHHVEERRTNPARALDPTNLAGLCARCHGRRRGGA